MKRIKQFLTAMTTAAAAGDERHSRDGRRGKDLRHRRQVGRPVLVEGEEGRRRAAKVVEAQGGSVTCLGPQNYDNLGPDAAKLIHTALSQSATRDHRSRLGARGRGRCLQGSRRRGVPLIIYNAGGIEAAERLGAINYIGSDEYPAGVAGGEYFGRQGAKNVLCVNTLPGAANTEARCRGIADGIVKGGGKSEQLPMPSSNFGNPTAVAQAIKAALLKDDTIDGVVTISTQDADSAANGISRPVSATRSSSARSTWTRPAQRIKDGKQLFAIDQQPYMQGFLAVSMLNGYVKYGLDLPTRPLLTGPASSMRTTSTRRWPARRPAPADL